ncbi:glycerol-3-phosphate 1-O-acyltransferase PlsY [Rhodovibrionaceae bacterium A322]
MFDPISWQLAWPYLLTALLGGYLLGSLPFGIIIARVFGLGDLRQIGSGNIGATNVLRTGRKDLAFLTLLLDSGKGAAAALIAAQWGPETMLVAGFAAVLGHNFPVWLGFKGGKGVATTLGTLIAVDWQVGLAACATWLVVALIFRMSSLSALVALAVSPVYAWYLIGDPHYVQFAALLAVLAWARHHANIRRILTGQEPKIGKK